jgi:hypothetical protein
MRLQTELPVCVSKTKAGHLADRTIWTIDRWIRAGKIKTVKKGNSVEVITASLLEYLLKEEAA